MLSLSFDSEILAVEYHEYEVHPMRILSRERNIRYNKDMTAKASCTSSVAGRVECEVSNPSSRLQD